MSKRRHIEVEVIHKSKLSSDEWRVLGSMMRKIQEQELQWLNHFHFKQTRAICISVMLDDMTVKESKRLFKGCNVLIAARDVKSKRIIGFCAIEEKPELGWATCDGLYVDPAWRHNGAASEMIERAFDKVKHDGLDSLELRVSLMNKEAQALYKKLGFTTVALKMEKWFW